MPLRFRMLRPRLHAWLLLTLCLCAVYLWSKPVAAGTLVIEPGREAEILGLFQPYRLAESVTPEWKLWNVRIRAREVSVELKGQGDLAETCELGLRHAEESDQRTFDHSQNFSFYFPKPAGPTCRAALLKLVEAVKRNDHDTFWRHEVEEAKVDPRWVSAMEVIRKDPLIHLAGFVALVVGMLTRELLRLPKRWRAGMLALLCLGVLLRLTITPADAAFDAWPFSRVPTLAALIWHGPVISIVSEKSPIFLTDITYKVGLVFGLLGPAVVFMHAWRMLGSHRAAVFAGGMIAVWPSHLRFSHADGTFISSIVFSGMSFALAHDALRHPSRNWRWCALGLLVPVSLQTFQLRPLNQIFAVLLVAAALLLGEGIPRARRILVAGVVSLATIVVSIPAFLKSHSQDLHHANASLVPSAISSFFSYHYNTLIRADITPPIALVLAVVGAVTLWRTQRRVAVFLLSWLGLFFVTHSIINPNSPLMQARYHLHLIVPFVLLAAAGLEALLSKYARAGWAAACMLLVSPAIHLRFIQDLDVNQPAENAFLLPLRKSIPQGCTVVEYVGDRKADSRMTRLGAVRFQGEEAGFYRVLHIAGDDPKLGEEINAARKQSCAMAYLGLACWIDGDPAKACVTLRRSSSRVVDELERDNHVYDENNHFANKSRRRFSVGLYDLKGDSGAAEPPKAVPQR
ncbi:MAG: hypothetical protein R3B07_20710 [Polyangiaceae bacterium]